VWGKSRVWGVGASRRRRSEFVIRIVAEEKGSRCAQSRESGYDCCMKTKTPKTRNGWQPLSNHKWTRGARSSGWKSNQKIAQPEIEEIRNESGPLASHGKKRAITAPATFLNAYPCAGKREQRKPVEVTPSSGRGGVLSPIVESRRSV